MKDYRYNPLYSSFTKDNLNTELFKIKNHFANAGTKLTENNQCTWIGNKCQWNTDFG